MGTENLPAISLDEHQWPLAAQQAIDSKTITLRELWRIVDHGILIRRKLDEQQPGEQARDRHVRLLSELQYHTLGRLAKDLASASPDLAAQHSRDLAQRLDESLKRDEAYSDHLLTSSDTNSAHTMFLCDAFHLDLQWYARVASYLEGEPEPDRAYAVKTRLDHLAKSLAEIDPLEGFFDSDAGDALERRRTMQQACRELERKYLDDRIADETQFPVDSASPVSLWNRRFQLSRLEAERVSIEPRQLRQVATKLHSTFADSSSDTNWIQKLQSRQGQLADLAEQRLLQRDSEQRRKECQNLAIAAKEESNDVLALIEDLPLPVAVELLRSATSDFQRLASTARKVEKPANPADNKSRDMPLLRTSSRIAKRCRNELQEKKLALRMERLLGPTIVAWMENSVLILILLLTFLIVGELALESAGTLNNTMRAAFAWTDLAICSFFLFEFTLKLCLAEGKLRYFRRHFLIDFLASLPYGFLGYQIAVAAAAPASEANLLRLMRFLRLPQFARYARTTQQLVRVGRLLFFLLRATDRLVRRHTHIFNRNILLFEPASADREEPAYRARLARLREHFLLRVREVEDDMTADARMGRVALSLADLRAHYESLPTTALHEPAPRSTAGRDIPAEDVIRELVEMTPERLVQRMGPAFPNNIVRYVRFFDLPLMRRLPVLRTLIAARDRGPGEVAALAANYLGFLLQWILNVGYFFADLHGTISGPIFLDKLGTILVSATARNAKRLILFGFSLIVLYAIVRLLGVIWLEDVFRWVRSILGMPLLILGGICLVIMMIGRWLRAIANQTSEEGERLVEAQFADQTKALKAAHIRDDFQLLANRVVAPELILRSLDDPDPETAKPLGLSAEQLLNLAAQRALPHRYQPDSRTDLLASHGEELVFLRNVALLHHDYLDSGLFRPSDTKATTQLLGNVALANLRRTNLARLLDGRKLRTLDLARASGSLFAGPYLWFQYMTRIITEETAKLIADFNRNAIPISRLACASAQKRDRYRAWIAKRLGITPASVPLPQAVGEFGNQPTSSDPPPEIPNAPRLETVDFTTMDFLGNDPSRDGEIEQKFGPMVLRLLRIQRQRAIRRAFRSFPLHQFPPAQRTLNPFTTYLDYVSGGRILILPPRILWWTLRAIAFGFRQTWKTVKEILHPPEMTATRPEDDSYTVALRKIHRMRKPGFMASLWLRAEVDLEYLGIPEPELPLTVGSSSLLEDDLNFIGSTRRERLAAQQIVSEQRRKTAALLPTLKRLGFEMHGLPAFLEKNYPHLQFRAAEVTRAIATAWIVDDEGLYSMATAIDGLRQVIDHAIDHENDVKATPQELPPRIATRPPGYKPKPSSSRAALRKVLNRLKRHDLDEQQTRRVIKYLKRHWPLVRGWVGMILAAPPDHDPLQLVHDKIQDVILRTDLWSDQIVVVRALQSLTVLDVYHYCRMVWQLGGYGEREGIEFPVRLPEASEPFEWATRVVAAGA